MNTPLNFLIFNRGLLLAAIIGFCLHNTAGFLLGVVFGGLLIKQDRDTYNFFKTEADEFFNCCSEDLVSAWMPLICACGVLAGYIAFTHLSDPATAMAPCISLMIIFSLASQLYR